MNNLIKSAFAAQFLLGIIAFSHNWFYFQLDNWIYLVYAFLLIIGIYLTWQAIFNKELSKTTKFFAVLIGTVPTILMLGWAVLLSISAH